MIEPIYRLFNGAFIDLDKLISISDVIYEHKYYIIRLEFLLRDHPLEIRVNASTPRKFFIDSELVQLVGDIDEEHIKLIDAWKVYKYKTCKKKCSASAN